MVADPQGGEHQAGIVAASRHISGKRYETSPPKTIPASGSGRCRVARVLAQRGGAELSGAAGARDRRLSGWRSDRHHRASDRAVVVRATRPAIRRREPARRCRQYRDRGGRARAPRRLHAAHRRCDQRGQCDTLRQTQFQLPPISAQASRRALRRRSSMPGSRPAYALQTIKEIPYVRWREYNPEDAVRFYALRLREAGMNQVEVRTRILNRDGTARAGLQSDPRHEHHGHPAARGGDEGIVAADMRPSAVAAQPRTAGSSIRTLLDRKAAKFGKDISPKW